MSAQQNNPPGLTAPLPGPPMVSPYFDLTRSPANLCLTSQTGDGLLAYQYSQWVDVEVQRKFDDRDRSELKQKKADDLIDAKAAHKVFQATVRTESKVTRMGKATASVKSVVQRRHFSRETANITVEVIRRSHPDDYLIKKVYARTKSPELELVEFYSADDVEADKANVENEVSGLKKLALPDYFGVIKLLVAQRTPIPVSTSSLTICRIFTFV